MSARLNCDRTHLGDYAGMGRLAIERLEAPASEQRQAKRDQFLPVRDTVSDIVVLAGALLFND
jgi:hypothetical protein